MEWTAHPIGARARGAALAGVMNADNRDRFLTARWNNALVAGLGLPALVYALVVLSTSVLTDRAGFVWLVIVGALY